MATVSILYHFSDGSSEEVDFKGASGIGDDIIVCGDDTAELKSITCDSWEVMDSDCSDYDNMEDWDDFNNLNDWGEYCDLVEEHGEAFVLRYADIGDCTDRYSLDGYSGCWESREKYAQEFYDDVCSGDNSMYSYIDWGSYARDLLMDCSAYHGSEGLHIFHN